MPKAQKESRVATQAPLDILLRFAGLAAILLGALYGYGALIKGIELHAAGQVVSDTLPLVPLEQLLVVGLVHAFLPLVFLFALVVFLIAWQERPWVQAKEGADAKSKSESKSEGKGLSRRGTWILNGFTAVSWTFAILSTSPVIAVIVGQAWLLYWLVQRVSFTRYVFAAIALYVVTTTLTTALNPDPLPVATLRLRSGTEIHGKLISKTENNWYLGVDDRRFIDVAARDVADSSVTTPPRPDSHSLFHQIFN